MQWNNTYKKIRMLVQINLEISEALQKFISLSVIYSMKQKMTKQINIKLAISLPRIQHFKIPGLTIFKLNFK